MQFGREWTKATVQFREVSALERVQLQRYKCNSAGSGPNLLSGLESVRLERVHCICRLSNSASTDTVPVITSKSSEVFEEIFFVFLGDA